MKMRIATRSLLAILCLTLSAPAFAGVLFATGPITGKKGFFVPGPNLPPGQDISDEFFATGAASTLEWGEWSAGFPTSFSFSIGTAPFGDDLANGTVEQNASNTVPSHFFGIWDVTVGIPHILMTGGPYWLTISNATDALNDGTQKWDDNGSSSATCNKRLSGVGSPCGPAGLVGYAESFTISGLVVEMSQATTPEPSSIMLFGSGILG